MMLQSILSRFRSNQKEATDAPRRTAQSATPATPNQSRRGPCRRLSLDNNPRNTSQNQQAVPNNKAQRRQSLCGTTASSNKGKTPLHDGTTAPPKSRRVGRRQSCVATLGRVAGESSTSSPQIQTKTRHRSRSPTKSRRSSTTSSSRRSSLSSKKSEGKSPLSPQSSSCTNKRPECTRRHSMADTNVSGSSSMTQKKAALPSKQQSTSHTTSRPCRRQSCHASSPATTTSSRSSNRRDQNPSCPRRGRSQSPRRSKPSSMTSLPTRRPTPTRAKSSLAQHSRRHSSLGGYSTMDKLEEKANRKGSASRRSASPRRRKNMRNWTRGGGADSQDGTNAWDLSPSLHSHTEYTAPSESNTNSWSTALTVEASYDESSSMAIEDDEAEDDLEYVWNGSLQRQPSSKKISDHLLTQQDDNCSTDEDDAMIIADPEWIKSLSQRRSKKSRRKKKPKRRASVRVNTTELSEPQRSSALTPKKDGDRRGNQGSSSTARTASSCSSDGESIQCTEDVMIPRFRFTKIASR